MIAKRLILMLLVMLGSVTGAWAESVTFTYGYRLTTTNGDYAVRKYIEENLVEQSNAYVKVTLVEYGIGSPTRTPNKVDPERVTYEGNATARSINVTNLQPGKVLILTVKDSNMTHNCSASKTEYNFSLASPDTDTGIQSITVTYQLLHTHTPAAEWSYDANQHWHACTGAVGICDANGKVDLANHTYGQDGAAYYTCSVCNYVNETRRTEFVGINYMNMTAVDGDMTIGMTKTGTPDDYTLQYSLDKIDWYTVALTETNSNIVTIPSGETCYFRHGGNEAITRVSTDYNHVWTFTMTGNGTIEAGGNIMSLIDATCQQTEIPDHPDHVFTKLFMDCDKLTKAPELPATSIGVFCYVRMFAGTGISVAPTLPATNVPAGAYVEMFKDCKNLVTVPALPGTHLGRRAYDRMFNGCDKLTSIEIANIESMVVEAGSSGWDNSFHEMLAGTAAGTNGVIIAPVEMMGGARITLPSNWQWATKLRLNEDPDNAGNFYTTFYDSRNDYTIAAGHKAYSGRLEKTDWGDEELLLTPTPDNIIPKGNGVILHGGSGEVLLTVNNDEASTIQGNVLTGSDENTTAPDFCYILSYGQNRLGFYRYAEGNDLSAHKAYLTYQHGTGAQARALRMVFADDNEVDGIQRIENGESEIENSAIYNLNGMRLNKLQKGINIVNGKKIIVK